MVAKKSPKKAARPRWPKGHPLAGRFAEKGLFAEFQKNLKEMAREAKKQQAREIKAQERAAKKAERAAALAVQKAATRERKNATLRETRAATRAARQQMMLRPDGHTDRRDLRGAKIYSWGKASTSRLREHITYAWHGAYRVTAGEKAMKEVMKLAQSMRRLPKIKGDGSFEIVLTPWFGNFTPAEAQSSVPGIAEATLAEFLGTGARVTYLGAFYTENVRGED